MRGGMLGARVEPQMRSRVAVRRRSGSGTPAAGVGSGEFGSGSTSSTTETDGGFPSASIPSTRSSTTVDSGHFGDYGAHDAGRWSRASASGSNLSASDSSVSVGASAAGSSDTGSVAAAAARGYQHRVRARDPTQLQPGFAALRAGAHAPPSTEASSDVASAAGDSGVDWRDLAVTSPSARKATPTVSGAAGGKAGVSISPIKPAGHRNARRGLGGSGAAVITSSASFSRGMRRSGSGRLRAAPREFGREEVSADPPFRSATGLVNVGGMSTSGHGGAGGRTPGSAGTSGRRIGRSHSWRRRGEGDRSERRHRDVGNRSGGTLGLGLGFPIPGEAARARSLSRSSSRSRSPRNRGGSGRRARTHGAHAVVHSGGAMSPDGSVPAVPASTIARQSSWRSREAARRSRDRSSAAVRERRRNLAMGSPTASDGRSSPRLSPLGSPTPSGPHARSAMWSSGGISSSDQFSDTWDDSSVANTDGSPTSLSGARAAHTVTSSSGDARGRRGHGGFVSDAAAATDDRTRSGRRLPASAGGATAGGAAGEDRAHAASVRSGISSTQLAPVAHATAHQADALDSLTDKLATPSRERSMAPRAAERSDVANRSATQAGGVRVATPDALDGHLLSVA